MEKITKIVPKNKNKKSSFKFIFYINKILLIIKKIIIKRKIINSHYTIKIRQDYIIDKTNVYKIIYFYANMYNICTSLIYNIHMNLTYDYLKKKKKNH